MTILWNEDNTNETWDKSLWEALILQTEDITPTVTFNGDIMEEGSPLWISILSPTEVSQSNKETNDGKKNSLHM